MDEQPQNPVIEESPRPKRGMGRNIVTDPNAPEYYSERAIYWFSLLLFSAFGAVMMAMNLRKIDKKAARQVVGFSLVYMVLEGIIISRFQGDTWLSLVFNCIGVALLMEIYWKPYIGAETKYRAKPIWKPLVIALVLLGLLILSIFTGRP